jgi:hypothetical protein
MNIKVGEKISVYCHAKGFFGAYATVKEVDSETNTQQVKAQIIAIKDKKYSNTFMFYAKQCKKLRKRMTQ